MKDSIISELMTIQREDIPALIDHLRSTDFFIAPASSKFHLDHVGGLAQHSWNVYRQLHSINESYKLGYSEDTIKICGLLHDFCKIDIYRLTKKPVKKDGRWIEEEHYAVFDHNPLGHGEKSVIGIQQFIKLSREEALAIRWHMGPWDAQTDSQRRSLNDAMNQCKLVKMLQLADLTASWLVE